MSNIEKKVERLYDVLHTLGKKRSLELLNLAKKAPKTYSELQKELGINSKLVSSKLKELIDLDVLKKEGDKYNLSKFGKKIIKKIKPLTKAVEDYANEVEKKVEKKAKEVTKKAKELVKKTSDIKKSVTTKNTVAKAVAKKPVVITKQPAPVVKRSVTTAKKTTATTTK